MSARSPDRSALVVLGGALGEPDEPRRARRARWVAGLDPCAWRSPAVRALAGAIAAGLFDDVAGILAHASERWPTLSSWAVLDAIGDSLAFAHAERDRLREHADRLLAEVALERARLSLVEADHRLGSAILVTTMTKECQNENEHDAA